jgi:hypothetical protein
MQRNRRRKSHAWAPFLKKKVTSCCVDEKDKVLRRENHYKVKQWKGHERVVVKKELSMAIFLHHWKINATIEKLQKKE